MATHRVGGEVDAFCTKCKLTLAHTILAMLGVKPARVRCNTCGGDHAFRSAPGARKTAGAPRSARATKQVISFEQRLEGKDVGRARVYNARDAFVINELVNHPTFGVGIIEGVRGDKVDITFRTEKKTLVHGRGGGEQPSKPAYQPMGAKSLSPADKQPPPDDAPGARLPAVAAQVAADDSGEFEEPSPA